MNFIISFAIAVAVPGTSAKTDNDGGIFGSWVQYTPSNLPYFSYTLDQIHDGNATAYNR